MTLRHGARVDAAVAEPSRTPRRVLSAFILGAALSLMGLSALAAGLAGARGLFVPFGASESAAPPSYGHAYAPERIAIVRYSGHRREDYQDNEEGDRRRRHPTLRASLVKLGGGGGHDPVCVRLCDGFFFPLPTAASDAVSQGAACNSLCPDAPTEVYYRNGADGVEGAVSAGGKPYTSLPVSLRYRATSNDTCTCHRDVVAYAPLKDATLKRGDAIMTPAGFVVFRGVENAPHQAGDFSALSAAGLPKTARAPLQEMERASLTTSHPTLRDWLVTQNTPALAYRSIPAQIAMRAPAPRSATPAGGGKIRLLAWRDRDE
jgi:hypothetical protein